jgi:hypothetical protein
MQRCASELFTCIGKEKCYYACTLLLYIEKKVVSHAHEREHIVMCLAGVGLAHAHTSPQAILRPLGLPRHPRATPGHANLLRHVRYKLSLAEPTPFRFRLLPSPPFVYGLHRLYCIERVSQREFASQPATNQPTNDLQTTNYHHTNEK